jgi:hypothetical protein
MEGAMKSKDELKALLLTMSISDRQKVERCAAKLRKVVNDNGHIGHVAALWIGIEVLDQTADDEGEELLH